MTHKLGTVDAVLRDPRFNQILVKKRRMRVGLSLLTLVVFFGFVLLVSTPIGAAIAHTRLGVMPLEIVIAVAIIIFTVLSTGAFVLWSNRVADPANRAFRRDYAG